MEINNSVIALALETAFEAGKKIMEVYNTSFEVEFKSDKSPLTLADRLAHQVISKKLAVSNIPLLSEEGADIDYDIRKNWKQYWLIDPLDGTKEFIKRNGEFTVNIALIENDFPVFGVIYAPVPGLMYWGSSEGSFRLNIGYEESFNFKDFEIVANSATRLPIEMNRDTIVVLASKSHMNEETENFINSIQYAGQKLEILSKGSSLKFCSLAEGSADIYPRFGPTMEWDTAAGHAISVYAGCEIIQMPGYESFNYNKPSLLNASFVARRK